MKFKNKQRYRQEAFVHNNKSLLVIALVLWIEQLVYGLVFHSPKSFTGKVHLITAGVCFAYTILLWHYRRQIKAQVSVKLWQELLQYSLVVFGLFVAVVRAVYGVNHDFSIPVIYIAVLYGSAFIFYYPPLWNFIVYGLTVLGFVGLSYYEYQGVLYETFIQDIAVNNLLAWIAVTLAYQRFTKQIDAMVVTEEQNQVLIHLSETDSLTKVYNRRKLDDVLLDCHERALAEKSHYAVIMSDLDYFKEINDQYGHTIGDQVLVEVADIFREHLGEAQILGRWGGEEFMILCTQATLEEASALAESLRLAFESHAFSIDRTITCSFGVSAYRPGRDSNQVVLRADEALYLSKDNGRNQVSIK